VQTEQQGDEQRGQAQLRRIHPVSWDRELRRNRSAPHAMRKLRAFLRSPVTRPHRAADTGPWRSGPFPRRGEFICLNDRCDAISPRESSPPSSSAPRRPTPATSAPLAMCGDGCRRFGGGGWRLFGSGGRGWRGGEELLPTVSQNKAWVLTQMEALTRTRHQHSVDFAASRVPASTRTGRAQSPACPTLLS
jgi:hypothetical protein